ncbi:MAG: hypothetical protein U5J83_01340 [Bryobacterales bacterium]|nr:hypothetical protein [Bryobacterales bacterium]
MGSHPSAALDMHGELVMETGSDQFRLAANGEEILLQAPSLASLRRAIGNVASRPAMDALEAFLLRANVTLTVQVAGASILSFPGNPNLAARSAGLRAGRLRLWPLARLWLRGRS